MMKTTTNPPHESLDHEKDGSSHGRAADEASHKEQSMWPTSQNMHLLSTARALVLLLLLSHFSRAQLCATPETAAYQAPPSLGFSRQEYWSGLPFPSPMHESEK